MINLQEVSKSYYLDGTRISVLKNVNLKINVGEFVAIMGPSGSGKSTLLNIIGCLDTMDSGKYYLGNTYVNTATVADLAALRNRRIGFVFQSFNLIPRINSQRNVELPMIYAGVSPEIRKLRSLAALDIVGLKDRAHHSAAHLSGGQQQRVAIARSIVNNPDIIIADEPTGALDTTTSKDIMHIFQRLNASGKTIVMVTHEEEIAAFAQRIIYVRDGHVMENTALNRYSGN